VGPGLIKWLLMHMSIRVRSTNLIIGHWREVDKLIDVEIKVAQVCFLSQSQINVVPRDGVLWEENEIIDRAE